MHIGLFIPCYVDQFYPQVAVATLELLEKLGHRVSVPPDQTCCGQPMANSGYERFAKKTMDLFVQNFAEFDYVVAPSGSCVYHVRKHFDIIEQTPEVQKIREKTLEICEFLVNHNTTDTLQSSFPYRVGLHESCHGQRGLRFAKSSELVGEPFSIIRQLLEKVEGIELVNLQRSDECCGFGGTFAVAEEAVSVKMGKDRIQDHILNGAQVITGTDMSCLMHMEGIIRRRKLPLRVMHVSEILNHSEQHEPSV
ncbi:(Fe-S)-binding protein [Catalinimonas niigatensis]|uniref:(Fe-S)-binding protein n=1 Tax=Catalinimonas niigatensis TaxID=1397264 RepID=UPI0026656394|nr:(Fe-S)-binding protein [Catalinimonas niigatensis]WPP53556.1 (Fe-S)-binding protein [Catalinimonas niigatensis]